MPRTGGCLQPTSWARCLGPGASNSNRISSADRSGCRCLGGLAEQASPLAGVGLALPRNVTTQGSAEVHRGACQRDRLVRITVGTATTGHHIQSAATAVVSVSD